MALNLTCDRCEHQQIVTIVDNGRSGFPDPNVACDQCGARGTFHGRSTNDPALEQMIALLVDAQSVAQITRSSPSDIAASDDTVPTCAS